MTLALSLYLSRNGHAACAPTNACRDCKTLQGLNRCAQSWSRSGSFGFCAGAGLGYLVAALVVSGKYRQNVIRASATTKARIRFHGLSRGNLQTGWCYADGVIAANRWRAVIIPGKGLSIRRNPPIALDLIWRCGWRLAGPRTAFMCCPGAATESRLFVVLVHWWGRRPSIPLGFYTVPTGRLVARCCSDGFVTGDIVCSPRANWRVVLTGWSAKICIVSALLEVTSIFSVV